ncbi:hypothetical protein O5282_12905 [Escherichia coli]|nr:hypothetical protein [Escherichia coli]
MFGNIRKGMQFGCVVYFLGRQIIITILTYSQFLLVSMEQQASIVADYWLLINYGLVADLANVNYVGDTTESVNTLSEK